MNQMEFISMRDFRTQTTQVWSRLANNEEIVITNNGRPRAFLVSIPEGAFEQMLSGIREAKAKIMPVGSQTGEGCYENEHTPEELKSNWQELRDMLAGIDGNSVDLKQMQAERRAAKYERFD
jgi:antitoxin (DNA-binding transcriptional repressor) of toxin-antitoxin stability system